jgi:hypothetical protein
MLNNEKVISKLQSLTQSQLIFGPRRNSHGQLTDGADIAGCQGWLTSAENAVTLICSENSPYLKAIKKFANEPAGYMIYESVLKVSSILQNLIADVKAGLLVSISDTVRAETFVDFLDHGRAYLSQKAKMESGVIIGVVFEDSTRRLCEKLSVAQVGRKLDDLISDLQKSGAMTAIQAKRARVGAHVRTKATHAQWSEFELGDVEETLRITEDLIERLAS